MKIKRKLLIKLLLFFTLLAYFGCSTDFEVIDNSVGTHFGLKNKGPKVKIFKGAEATQMKNKLEQMMGKLSSFNIFRNSRLTARGSENLEIDFSEIMEVIDTLGIKNYTFKIINHPDDNIKIFHNLVVTEMDENLKLKLIKYEMTDEFALGYNNNSEKFVDFKGTISSIPIGLDPSIDPCEPLIIEIPDTPGGSGYDSSGDNSSTNPNDGNNDGSSGSSGSGGGCINFMIICRGNEIDGPCGLTYNSWGSYKSSQYCGNGRYDYEIVIQFFSCRMASDPCAEDDGLVGILPVNLTQPCERLKSLMDPTKQNILPEINWLKNKSINNEPIEWSSSFNKNSLQNERKQGTELSVEIMTDREYVGAVHLHPKTGYPMFSWVDLRTLLAMRNHAALSEQANVTLMLVAHNPNDPANPNVYALFIDNPQQLQTQLNNMWNAPRFTINGVVDSDEEKIRKIHREMAIKYEENKNNLEAYFLQYTAAFGISMYKSNNDVSQWSKLELQNLNGTQIAFPNPCLDL